MMTEKSNKTFLLLKLGTISLLLALLIMAISFQTQAEKKSIRLGWQVPWATQGQLVMGLKNTNLPELNGIKIEFIGFSYGGPLNRAALAGEVDILLTADQPALVLLSKTDKFIIVGRMMYNRVCLYVPPDSSIKEIKDLKGKFIMGPVGAAAERVAMAAVYDSGIQPDQIRMGSLDMSQQAALVKNRKGDKWGAINALYGFDPIPAILEDEGLVRLIHCGKVVSLILASKEMVNERSEDLQNFLRAFYLSWFFFAKHPEKSNQWFSSESRLNVNNSILDNCASIEPNRFSESIEDIRMTFIPEDLEIMNEALEFLLKKGIIKKRFDVNQCIDLGPLNTAIKSNSLRSIYKMVGFEGNISK